MKKLLAVILALALSLTAFAALADVTFSWWGGDARHEATLKAIEAFKVQFAPSA